MTSEYHFQHAEVECICGGSVSTEDHAELAAWRREHAACGRVSEAEGKAILDAAHRGEPLFRTPQDHRVPSWVMLAIALVVIGVVTVLVLVLKP